MKKIISLMLAVMLMASVATVFAAADGVYYGEDPYVSFDTDDGGELPEGTAACYYYINCSVSSTGQGEVSVDKSAVPCDSDETVTFTATDKGSDKFDKWTFSGEYDVVSGNVDEVGTSTDKTVVIRPKSDINVRAEFVNADDHKKPADDHKKATRDQKKATPDGQDTSTTSPKTGDMTLYVFAGILLAALCAAMIAFRKFDY